MQNTKCSAQKQHLLGCNNVLTPNIGLFHSMCQAGWKPYFLVQNVMLPAFWHLELASKKLGFRTQEGRGWKRLTAASLLACDAAAVPMGNFSEVPKCLSTHALD